MKRGEKSNERQTAKTTNVCEEPFLVMLDLGVHDHTHTDTSELQTRS